MRICELEEERKGARGEEEERGRREEMEVNTSTPQGLKALNDHLTDESYISGYVCRKGGKKSGVTNASKTDRVAQQEEPRDRRRRRNLLRFASERLVYGRFLHIYVCVHTTKTDINM